MPVSKRARFEVFKRDSFTCQYCGRTPPAVILHADHVRPKSDGGSDGSDNLVTACEGCNLGKSNIPLNQVIQSVKEMAKRAKNKREQVEAYEKLLTEERAYIDADIKRIGSYWHDNLPGQKELGRWVFGPARRPTIKRFLERLTVSEIIEAIDITFANCYRVNAVIDDDGFKYFCGVCWNKYREAGKA